MNDTQKILVDMLKEAVNEFYSEERFLLNYNQGRRFGMEQSIAFRVSYYFNKLLDNTSYYDLDLDLEYNKNHGDQKRTLRFPKGVRPDLILHQRGTNEKNILVVEFKGWWNRQFENDIKKLEDFTNPKDTYKYTIGILVIIGKTEASFRYFIEGDEYE